MALLPRQRLTGRNLRLLLLAMAFTLAQQPMTTLVLLAVTALLAGLARGFSGFGAALIFVPVAARLVGPQLAVPLLLVTDAILTLPLLLSSWKQAQFRAVALMSAGALAGIPLGTFVLRVADPLHLRWGIVVLVALMLALLLSGWRYRGTPRDAATVAVGSISGLFSGIAQIGGPPVVAYWLGGRTDPAAMRASTILYFAIATVIALVSYANSALVNVDVLQLSAFLAPFFGMGLLLGSTSFHWADAAVFRRICIGMIALALVLGLPTWG
jgi:uncharacterized protein